MLQKLKEAIEKQDWELVKQFYCDMTGSSLEEPKIKKKAAKKKSSTTDENFRLKKVAKKKVLKNKFDPNTEIEKENGYDNIDDSVKPTERSRQPYKQPTVFCEDCRKTINVDPIDVRTPYFCGLLKVGKSCPNKR